MVPLVYIFKAVCKYSIDWAQFADDCEIEDNTVQNTVCASDISIRTTAQHAKAMCSHIRFPVIAKIGAFAQSVGYCFVITTNVSVR